MTQKDGDSHQIDYTILYLWGSRPFIVFKPGIGGSSRGYSLSYVNSGITVAYIAASSTFEPPNAQRLPTALHRSGSSLHLDRCRQGDKGEQHSIAIDYGLCRDVLRLRTH